jgi:hypothetical protein
MLVFSLLLGCAPEVNIVASQGGCTEFDYDNPAPSELVSEVGEDGTAVVSRTNVLLDAGDYTFEPVIVPDRRLIEVFETWTGAGEGDPFCFVPSVSLEGLRGEFELRWYLAEGDVVPFATVELKP